MSIIYFCIIERGFSQYSLVQNFLLANYLNSFEKRVTFGRTVGSAMNY